MMSAEDRRKNDQYYLSQGRCPHCGGKRAVIPGMKRCVVCREANVESKRRRFAYREAHRLCRECGKPLDDTTHTTCESCREKRRRKQGKKKAAKQKEWYDRMREDGRCVSCGKWAEPGRARCAECQKKNNDRIKRCDPNREKANALRKYRIENGLCIDCGAVLNNGYKRCNRCLELRRDSCRKYDILRRIRRDMANVRRNQGQGKG